MAGCSWSGLRASCTSPGLQSGPPHFASSASHPPCPLIRPAQLGLGGRWWRGPGLFVSVWGWGGKRGLAVPRRRSPRPGGPHASGHSRWARGPSSSWWPLAASCPITKQERRSAPRAVPSRGGSVPCAGPLASGSIEKLAPPHGASCRACEASRSPSLSNRQLGWHKDI